MLAPLENGENNTHLAEQFGIAHSAISTIWKKSYENKECLINLLLNQKNISVVQKSMHRKASP